MGVAERRERQRAELREQILESARKILLDNGFEGLTMRRIAEAIEYSAGTIYLHFESREAIALQLVNEGFAELMGFIAPVLTIGDPLERLRAIGDAYLRFGLERPQTYRLIFMTDPKLSRVVSEHIIDEGDDDPGARCFDELVHTVGELVENGTFKRVEPEVAANCLWSALHGIVSLHITCEEMLTDPVATADVMHRTLLEGFQA
jgi:AcrR family transcriptional regulator